MTRALFLAFVLAGAGASASAGCGQDPGYDRALVEGHDHANVTRGEVEARQKLQTFQATKSRLPTSIEELESATGRLPALPRDYYYEYDASVPEIRVVKGE